MSRAEQKKLYQETGQNVPGAVIPLARSNGQPFTQEYIDNVLSPEYRRDWLGKRPPLLVVLPCGCSWNIDSKATGSEHGWTVTGKAPDLTATPSINCIHERGYHGWLRNGELSDDLEGRTYG